MLNGFLVFFEFDIFKIFKYSFNSSLQDEYVLNFMISNRIKKKLKQYPILIYLRDNSIFVFRALDSLDSTELSMMIKGRK